MSISALSSYGPYSAQSSTVQALLKQIQAKSANQGQTGSTELTDYELSVSPMARYMSQAPSEIADTLKDLVTTREDVSGDLEALQAYYADNPDEQAKLDSFLQLQSASLVQTSALSPAMQAGVGDLYALSSGLDGTATTEPSLKDLGKALLAALQEGDSSQSTLFDALKSSDEDSTNRSSLISYLT